MSTWTRWTRGLMAVALLGALSAGCKKDSESNGEGEEKDSETLEEEAPEKAAALWALAPPEARAGVVLRPGALARIAAGIETLRESYERLPGAGERLAMIESELENPINFSVLRPEEWEEIGLDLSKPAAGFFYEDGGVLILPVTDRDAFVKATGAETEGEGDARLDKFEDAVCKEIDGRYVCASEEKVFEQLGEGGELAKAGGERPPELRGDVEFDLKMEPGEAELRRMQATARLERGAATVRLSMEGDTSEFPPVFATEPRDLAKAMSEAEPAGFVRLHLALGMVAQQAPAGPTPFGASARELVSALTGEFVAYSLAGDEPSGYLKVGVSEPKMYRDLVNKLCALASGKLPGLETTLEDDHCRGSVSPAKIARAAGEEIGPLPFDELEFDISVEDGAVVVALNHPGKKGRAAKTRTAAGRQLMRGPWSLAFWGAGGLAPESLAAMHQVPDAPEEILHTVAWLLLHLNELGLGMRVEDGRVEGMYRIGTQWANPDEVLSELEPLLARAAQGEDVGSELQALAKNHPDTPLGRSLGGESGLAPVAAAAGMAAAVAVPAFVKYQQKSKATEAQVFVRKLHDSARAYYMDGGKKRFPQPSVGPTPPRGACCEGGGKCAPDASQWESPTWTALRFSVADPHYYSYEYEVAADGKSFTASAYGDLDCDGEYSTFRMTGSAGPNGVTAAPLERIDETE